MQFLIQVASVHAHTCCDVHACLAGLHIPSILWEQELAIGMTGILGSVYLEPFYLESLYLESPLLCP